MGTVLHLMLIVRQTNSLSLRGLVWVHRLRTRLTCRDRVGRRCLSRWEPLGWMMRICRVIPILGSGGSRKLVVAWRVVLIIGCRGSRGLVIARPWPRCRLPEVSRITRITRITRIAGVAGIAGGLSKVPMISGIPRIGPAVRLRLPRRPLGYKFCRVWLVVVAGIRRSSLSPVFVAHPHLPFSLHRLEVTPLSHKTLLVKLHPFPLPVFSFPELAFPVFSFSVHMFSHFPLGYHAAVFVVRDPSRWTLGSELHLPRPYLFSSPICHLTHGRSPSYFHRPRSHSCHGPWLAARSRGHIARGHSCWRLIPVVAEWYRGTARLVRLWGAKSRNFRGAIHPLRR